MWRSSVQSFTADSSWSSSNQSIPWNSSMTPYLPFRLKTGGAAEIIVKGQTFQRILSVFIGIDSENTYKGKIIFRFN